MGTEGSRETSPRNYSGKREETLYSPLNCNGTLSKDTGDKAGLDCESNKDSILREVNCAKQNKEEQNERNTNYLSISILRKAHTQLYAFERERINLHQMLFYTNLGFKRRIPGQS